MSERRYRNTYVSFYVECSGRGLYSFVFGTELWVNGVFVKNSLWHYQPQFEHPLPKYVIEEVQHIICERELEAFKVYQCVVGGKKKFDDIQDHHFGEFRDVLATVREMYYQTPQRGQVSD